MEDAIVRAMVEETMHWMMAQDGWAVWLVVGGWDQKREAVVIGGDGIARAFFILSLGWRSKGTVER